MELHRTAYDPVPISISQPGKCLGGTAVLIRYVSVVLGKFSEDSQGVLNKRLHSLKIGQSRNRLNY